LHNIAKQYNIAGVDIYREDIEEVNIEAENEINENMRARGHIIRETIIQRYFT